MTIVNKEIVILEKDKNIIVDTFKNFFGDDFVWNGDNKTAFLIKITKKLK